MLFSPFGDRDVYLFSMQIGIHLGGLIADALCSSDAAARSRRLKKNSLPHGWIDGERADYGLSSRFITLLSCATLKNRNKNSPDGKEDSD